MESIAFLLKMIEMNPFSARPSFFIYYFKGFSVSEIQAAREVFESHGIYNVDFVREFELGEDCYNPVRRQYNADCLLEKFSDLIIEGADKHIFIVDVDIYSRGTNFIFGLAELDGRKAIVSISRLKIRKDSSGEELYLKRLKTEVIHESCHLLGLNHCSNPYCAMSFSNTLADTDRKGESLCVVCMSKLEQIIEGYGL